MSNFYETFLKPHQTKFAIVIILGIFAWAAYYAYMRWGKPKDTKLHTEIHQAVGDKDVTIYLFHVDWCTHCKKAKPHWDSFKNQYNGRVINGSKITCVDINCTDTDSPEITQAINKFSITAYPTVKMMKDNQFYEFDAKIDEKNLAEFVNQVVV